MTQYAVVFDVDGPLLDLGPAEEQAFFTPFKTLFGIEGLSNDWDSYRIRNDREIIHEILEGHLGERFEPDHYHALLDEYDRELSSGFAQGRLKVTPIPGALQLLQTLSATNGLSLGMATANIRRAAEIRLRQAGMWDHVRHHPGAADEGGHKHEVLARVIAGLNLPPERVVYIGDNLNDLDAAQFNRTHFIGFHVAEPRRRRLADNGATVTAGDHRDTLKHIDAALSIS
jgi:phosphoglycolate phosphatase-like HAD superfamily hydrolase